MIVALEQNALSSLSGTACCLLSTAPPHTESQPQQGSCAPICWQCLVEPFAEEKVIGLKKKKVVSHLVLRVEKTKFILSEN